MKYKLLIFLLLIFCKSGLSQNKAIGSWSEHLPYIHAKRIIEAKDEIYCSTDEGFFSYNTTDQSIRRYSKLNGLSDFGIANIAYSSQYNVVVIAYQNANIDLLYSNGVVKNINDIKRKNIPGNKSINSIFIDGKYAYLGCGFGIVVLDIERQEIKDTYYIGQNGISINVFQCASDQNFIYAATEDGVYKALRSGVNLFDYNNWSKIIDDTSNQGDFNFIVSFNQMLFVNYSRQVNDTIMAYNGSWGVALPNELLMTSRFNSITVHNGILNVVNDFSYSGFDANLSRIFYYDGTVVNQPTLRDGISDVDNVRWLADKNKGLIRYDGSSTAIVPDGPFAAGVCDIKISKGVVWAVHGPKNRGWTNLYTYAGFSYLDNGNWTSFDGYSSQTPLFGQYNFYDNVSICIDPSNKYHVFVGASGPGLLEFNVPSPLKFYRDTNSTLLQQDNNPGQVKVHGIALDENQNLWVSNAGTPNVIQVLKNNGQWKRFGFMGSINSSSKCGQLLIDKNGMKWLTIFENSGGKEGILVFNDNNTIDNIADDKYEVVDFGSNRVRCIEQDLEGTIWAGTDQGIYVFYPPNIVPQQILIKQDNSYQYLLATDAISVIAIDGANRKWVGTESSGLYLFSNDGQNQIKHFTSDNSPLFTNNITALAIDEQSGMVYIGTDKGIVSYQGDAVVGKEVCDDLLVYPNPVPSGFTSSIAIKGVIDNGKFKIADAHGGLVYEGKAFGGQAIWDGKNLAGEKVNSGVYIVYSMDELGENNCETKLLLLK